MLRVTIEIVPWGEESRKRLIETVTIARTTAWDDPEDYTVKHYDATGKILATAKVEAHGRKDGARELVRRALNVLVGL